MSRYLSPLVTEGEVAAEGLSTVALAATTIFTTPNKDDYNGALYEADCYVKCNTLDGGTTPTVALSLTVTEGGTARTITIPLMSEAGAIATAFSLGTSDRVTHGRVYFRADKNTNVQWTRTAGGTPSNNGNFDVFIVINRVR